MTTQTFAVTGMTCSHCVSAVTDELRALDGVTDVAVELVADGASSITVTAAEPLSDNQLVAALDEAGEYRFVPA